VYCKDWKSVVRNKELENVWSTRAEYASLAAKVRAQFSFFVKGYNALDGNQEASWLL
jgi:hypothetical protein